MTTPTTTTLPVIDLSLLAGSEADVREFREELRRATHEVGFFYLIGHGIPTAVIDNMMEVSRQFFALPEFEKLAIENTNSPHFRGYTRMGGELTQGKTDWREQIDIGAERHAVSATDQQDDFWVLQGPNLWPENLPQLEPAAIDWMERLGDISRTLLAEWAVALGAPRDTFDTAFDRMPSPHLKIARYPGSRAGAGQEPVQGVGAHKDLGVLTLLYVEEGKEGLQVQHDGQWIDAPPVSHAFVVNIGELLEIATDGYLKATLHRVISSQEGEDRISLPFFYGPRLDAHINVIDLDLEYRNAAQGITTDPGNIIHSVYGQNWLKSRVRAHPNVVAAHHPHLL
ncbi:2-oxoglutarate and iron-dependent oxygenase domain-containing protein [Alpinimonas psychrophila]|uniref:Isopenicillin N synthase-like dioxygenase n=1 Tax=Alpinimonas psychrophila TaxID=748908 RepID=A0A7W3PNH2_9MICO|nr:isopenicillin N synthase family oxygenase [Alpinimonas psychrophila]MBA8828452.1 isopenicillin N synthase-like dioxygenase [Alpinimonas psychrophila]